MLTSDFIVKKDAYQAKIRRGTFYFRRGIYSNWRKTGPRRIPFTICCFCNLAHLCNSIRTWQHQRAFLSYHKSLNLYRCKIELLFFLSFLSPCIRKKFFYIYNNLQQFLFKTFYLSQVR